MIDLYPTKCNICSGKVIYTSNKIIYGRPYGSGKCYYCTNCHAYVGTHEPRPKEAFGLLADSAMREMKIKCHEVFDAQWKSGKTGRERHQLRQKAYRRLAKDMDIPYEECHFGYFTLEQLKKAFTILKTWTT